MDETKIFARAGEKPWTEVAPGNRRRVLLYTDEMMIVEFGFDEGGVGALHSHPHVQASYVAEGSFDVTVGDQVSRLSAGDSFIVPSGIVHGVKALEAGKLIDSFTPHRADFLE